MSDGDLWSGAAVTRIDFGDWVRNIDGGIGTSQVTPGSSFTVTEKLDLTCILLYPDFCRLLEMQETLHLLNHCRLSKWTIWWSLNAHTTILLIIW